MILKSFEIELAPLQDVWAPQFSQIISNADLTRYTLTGSLPMRVIDIAEAWEKERKAGSVQWAIYAKGTFVGACGLHSHRDIYRSWEFRIFKAPTESKGVGAECTRLVTEYAFERLNAHRVWGGTHADNIAMQKCFLKAGYKEEGRLREELYCFGKYADAVRYGILETEWKSLTSAEAELEVHVEK